ncbi:MAG: acetate--CoA ligase family protein, partial [Candidatus Binataceae bacterium]
MNHDSAAVRSVIDRAKAQGRTSLTPEESSAVCHAFGIARPREELVKSARAVADAARRIGFPVVMKISSRDILHKTEAGCVIAGIADEAAATGAYETLVANAKRYRADAHI